MTIDTEQAVTVTLTITAMDLESALVLMEEAESNIEQGSLAGVIGGKMGQVLFSVDQLDPRSPTLRAAVETDTSSAPCEHVWVSQPVHQCAKCGCSPYDTQTS